MRIVSNKNHIALLAGVLIVAMVIMALVMRRTNVIVFQPYEVEIQQLEEQSTSDEINSIEEDLLDTDLSDLDRELQEIDQELEAAY